MALFQKATSFISTTESVSQFQKKYNSAIYKQN